jgi:hypothetical protein
MADSSGLGHGLRARSRLSNRGKFCRLVRLSPTTKFAAEGAAAPFEFVVNFVAAVYRPQKPSITHDKNHDAAEGSAPQLCRWFLSRPSIAHIAPSITHNKPSIAHIGPSIAHKKPSITHERCRNIL